MKTAEKGPPDDLYVYCIKGAFPSEDEDRLGGTFIGNWLEDAYSYLFFHTDSEERVRACLDGRAGLEYVDSYRFSYRGWQGDTVERMVVGSFEICPVWRQSEPLIDGKTRIVLDPGVVFGSGLHPTTRDCLKALSWVREQERFEGLLDIGTGTGILAVAGILLEGRRAVAVDLNPLCIRTAGRNARLNRVEPYMDLVCGPGEEVLHRAADMIAANLPFSVTNCLLELEGFRRRKWLALSGTMRSQVYDLKNRLYEYGMDVVREWETDMIWHTLLVKGQK